MAGHAVNTSPELQEQVGKYRHGDKIEVVIVRDDVEKVLKMELKNKEGNTEIIKKDKNAIISILGAEFETLSAEELRFTTPIHTDSGFLTLLSTFNNHGL